MVGCIKMGLSLNQDAMILQLIGEINIVVSHKWSSGSGFNDPRLR